MPEEPIEDKEEREENPKDAAPLPSLPVLALIVSIAALTVSFLSFRVSKEALHTSQRAYVSVHNQRCSFVKTDTDYSLACDIDLANEGNTPATAVRITYTLKANHSNEFDQRHVTLESVEIGPKETASLKHEFESVANFQMTDALRSGTTYLTLEMQGNYIDIFDDEHKLRGSCFDVVGLEPVELRSCPENRLLRY